jgi:CheY-like chemotaxis protein/MinD-like ATPase involved in chromosome partitioning or flagellar assembly
MPEKILIVDDDVDTLRLVGLMLQRQGYQIVAASSGHQALNMATTEKPDLIILDVMMPDLDGYEVTRQLRGSPATASIPIIMFTAKSQVDDKVTGFEVGADDYLTKPTQPRELFAHVKAVLSRGAKSKQHTSSAPPAEKGNVIGILAAKGGLGVSTMAVNLGITLRYRHNKDVLIAEFRPGEGSINLDLGYPRSDSLSRLLKKPAIEISSQDVESELLIHSTGLRLLLSSYQPRDSHLNQNVNGCETIARHLSYMSNQVILDLGPALPPKTEKLLGVCDTLVVVMEPIPTTITRTKALLEALHDIGFGKGRIHLTLVTRQRSEMQLSWSQAQEQLGQPIGVAFTPSPEHMYQASKANVPVVTQHPDSLLAQQFIKLADTVLKFAPQKA